MEEPIFIIRTNLPGIDLDVNEPGGTIRLSSDYTVVRSIEPPLDVIDV